MKKLLLLFLILNACTSTPPPAEPDYKSILRSHDPLTDEQLAKGIGMLSTRETNIDVRGYLVDRLSTEDFSRMESQLKAQAQKPLPERFPKHYAFPYPSQYYQPKHGEITPKEAVTQLLAFHQPETPAEKIAYINRMLDFMELPIPYPRKVNGLRNIQRVMAPSAKPHNLNAPEMKEIRKRLYDLALSEKSPDNVRRALAGWLREQK